MTPSGMLDVDILSAVLVTLGMTHITIVTVTVYLHRAQAVLAERLAREGRTEMAQACFDFLPWRAELDLAGWPESDIFAHM